MPYAQELALDTQRARRDGFSPSHAPKRTVHASQESAFAPLLKML